MNKKNKSKSFFSSLMFQDTDTDADDDKIDKGGKLITYDAPTLSQLISNTLHENHVTNNLVWILGGDPPLGTVAELIPAINMVMNDPHKSVLLQIVIFPEVIESTAISDPLNSKKNNYDGVEKFIEELKNACNYEINDDSQSSVSGVGQFYSSRYYTKISLHQCIELYHVPTFDALIDKLPDNCSVKMCRDHLANEKLISRRSLDIIFRDIPESHMISVHINEIKNKYEYEMLNVFKFEFKKSVDSFCYDFCISNNILNDSTSHSNANSPKKSPSKKNELAETRAPILPIPENEVEVKPTGNDCSIS
jgi:hypothetical protein